jgi:Carbohydrate binding domain
MSFSATSAQSRLTFHNFSGGGRFNASVDEFIISTSPIPADGQIATATPLPATATVPTLTASPLPTTNTPLPATATATSAPATPPPASTTPVVGSGAELIGNPGFELDADGNAAPDGWSNNANFRRSNLLVRTGSFAGRHSSTANVNYTVAHIIPNITAGQNYDIAGWLNIPATSDTFSINLRVRWRNGSNSVLRTDTIRILNATTNGWIQATGRYTAPAGTTNAQLQMVVGSLNASIVVDDFSLRAAGGTPSPTATPIASSTPTAIPPTATIAPPTAVVPTPTSGVLLNLLNNGGFENGSAGGWANNGDFSIVNSAAYHGDFGVRMSGGGRLEQVISTVAGQTYYVSAQIRIDDILNTPAWGGLRVTATDFQSWGVLGTSLTLTGTQEPLGTWVRVDFSFVATTGSSRISFENFSPGQFNASADEFVVSTNPIP